MDTDKLLQPNILIDSRGVALLSDFGMSRVVKEVSYSSATPLAATYMLSLPYRSSAVPLVYQRSR